MRFRTKLMVSYLALIFLVSLAFYIFFERTVQDELIEESRANLFSQAELMKLLIEKEGKSLSPQLLVRKSGAAVKARVTLIVSDGRVIGDSDVSESRVDELENHINRPEIQSAIKTGSGSSLRYSSTLRRDMLYVALPAGEPLNGFIRLALPLDYLAVTTAKVQKMLGTVAFATFLAALLLSYIFSNITSRPIREIAAKASLIGREGGSASLLVNSADEVGELAAVINEMSKRIDSQMRNLVSEKQRLDTILNSMGEGVMVAAADGSILLVNPAFRTLFGIIEDIEGKKLIETTRHPDLIAAFSELEESEGELIREIGIHPGGRTLLTHWARLTVNGCDQGVVAVFHDITDMKRTENIRRDFVANVSHRASYPGFGNKRVCWRLSLMAWWNQTPSAPRRFVEVTP